MRAAMVEQTAKFFDGKVSKFGPTPKGVDWNGEEDQALRFEQLLKIVDTDGEFSINDVGCGYGALVKYLLDQGVHWFEYFGCDISSEQVKAAKKFAKMELDRHAMAGAENRIHFDVGSERVLRIADYSVESGIFNMKMGFGDDTWKELVIGTLNSMNDISGEGFAFNMMTTYVDFKRPDLFYADPCEFFDLCKKKYSKRVSLIHDYRLYEFTILVRKDDR